MTNRKKIQKMYSINLDSLRVRRKDLEKNAKLADT